MSLIFAILFALLPSCPTEDSNNCKWDATAQGNHQGQSFINLAGVTFK